jgi:outer membrane immunogenic protein
MKKIILASVAVVAMSAPSFAADLAARPYTKAPAPMVSPATNWSGFYVGAMGGYGWSNSVSASVGGVNLGTANTDALKGGFGGGTIGYNWQAPGSQFVWGLEVDAAGGSIGYSETFGPAVVRDRINAMGSVTGRLGVAFDSVLLYAKGGYAWANNKVSADVAGVNVFSQTRTHSGWTVGGGLEWMFAPAWSAKAEYMYADFSKANYGAALLPPGVDVGASVHTIKVGVNYHFGWGGPTVRY